MFGSWNLRLPEVLRSAGEAPLRRHPGLAEGPGGDAAVDTIESVHAVSTRTLGRVMRNWLSIRVEFVQGGGRTFWPRPGRGVRRDPRPIRPPARPTTARARSHPTRSSLTSRRCGPTGARSALTSPRLQPSFREEPFSRVNSSDRFREHAPGM
jgi:hypothetical protein